MPRHSSSDLLLCLAALVVVVLMTACIGVQADTIEVPLCGEKHGFADESNDHFLIPVDRSPGEGEAIILIASPLPMMLSGMLAQWLYLNASYYIREGPMMMSTSIENGILELKNVAAGTDIEVRVHRVRPDRPVPFRFFSFFANQPVCHIAVSPDNTFIAPVPHKLSGTSTPVTTYFKTMLPLEHNAARMSIVSDGHAARSFQFMDKNNESVSRSSGDVLQASTGNSILFSYTPTPNDDTMTYCYTTVTVTYADVKGGTASPATGPQAAPSGGNKTGASSGSGQATNTAPASTSMSLLRRMLWIALIVFVLWQVCLSVYNFRVLGKRDLMEIVPCAETVAAGARGVQLMTSRSLGATHRRQDGYNSVHNPDDPYA